MLLILMDCFDTCVKLDTAEPCVACASVHILILFVGCLAFHGRGYVETVQNACDVNGFYSLFCVIFQLADGCTRSDNPF
jgi:hypothetical protein